MPEITLQTEVKYLKGVGPARSICYGKLGIKTISDLLFHFPRTYEDLTTIKKIADIDIGQTACFIATVGEDPREYRIRGGMVLFKTYAFDDSGRLDLTFFNQSYVKRALQKGEQYLFYGKITGNLLKKEATTVRFEHVKDGIEPKLGIMPCYSLTAGLTNKMVQNNVSSAISLCIDQIEEYIPENVIEKYELINIKDAIKYIHFAPGFDELSRAKRRLTFDELFVMQTGLMLIKQRRSLQKGIPMNKDVDMTAFLNVLPYELTGAQKRTLNEILADLKLDTPMNRIIQGDVGSGKTAVAMGAIYFACKNGSQAAFMVPTEILAEQHYQTIAPLLGKLSIRCGILTGSTSAAQKKEIKSKTASGEIDVLIGTHALIEHDIVFNDLALVITDEQHRFGVRHRAALADKGNNPHVLVMSATPIPRSLGLVLYGDLDISVLDELPSGRQKIDTFLVDDTMRERVNKFIKKQIEAGSQVFIVCPLVEESDKSDLAAAEQFADELKSNTFKGYKIAFVHGRMKAAQKNEIMRGFAHGEIDILVATTVIEVGIDVANATLMIIENAERFGLSQLHQLRGRVGRGDKKSYCIMFNGSSSPLTKERLDIMCKTNDGFEIAKKDFELRGPGEFFGERQHGLMPFKIADIFSDLKTLYEAREAAETLLSKDPKLQKKENINLRKKISDTLYSETKQNTFN